MIVTPTTTDLSTEFITFDPNNLNISWVSNSNADVGLFIIDIIGNIYAQTNFSSS